MIKKNINITMRIVLLCLFLVSCSKNNIEHRKDPENIHQFDCQVQFMPMGQNQTIAEAPNYFYHISGNFLYSISKKDGKVRVLDNNPDTLDDREENLQLRRLSNAYFEFPISVQYIDEKLYVVGKELKTIGKGTEFEGNVYEDSVYEVDTSGSGRKIIFKSDRDVDSIVIHRGYLYFSTNDFYSIKIALNEDKENNLDRLGYRLQRIPLDNLSAEPETIYEQTNKLGYINQMIPIDDVVYFVEAQTQIDSKTIETIKEAEEQINKGYILDYELNFQGLDLTTKENKILNTDGANISLPMPISGGELLYAKNYGNLEMAEVREIIEEGKKFPEVERKLIFTDYKMNRIKDLDFHLPAEDSGLVFGYGNYFCVDNMMTSRILKKPRTLKFFDREAKLVDEIEMFDRAGLVLGMDEKHLYMDVKPLEEEELNGIYRLKLENVGSNKLRWEEFFTYQPETNNSKTS